LLFRRFSLMLAGILCISLFVRSEADSFTELMESATSLYKSVKYTLDTVTAELDARDAVAAVVVDSAVVAADTATTAAVVIAHAVVATDTAVTAVASVDSAVVVDTAVAAPVKKAEKPPVPPKPPKIYPISVPEIEMVFVKGGKFKMGCSGIEEKYCLNDERPIHEIKIGNYLMGKYPVTQKQWGSVMGISPAHFEGDDLPVEQVSWDEAQEFVKRLNAMTNKKYRLPTEAEWEYAALGGANANGERFSGHNFLDDVAWYEYNSNGQTQRVGTKQPNELGLYDMVGNVWEWVNDWYERTYYKDGPVSNPLGPRRGSERVYRGGGFDSYEQNCRIHLRNYNRPGYRSINLGLRLAASP